MKTTRLFGLTIFATLLTSSACGGDSRSDRVHTASQLQCQYQDCYGDLDPGQTVAQCTSEEVAAWNADIRDELASGTSSACIDAYLAYDTCTATEELRACHASATPDPDTACASQDTRVTAECGL